MDFLNTLNTAFSGNSALGKIATSYVTGLANAGSKPKPIIVQQAAPAPVAASSDFDLKKWGMIGGGIFAAIIVLSMILKRK